MQERKAFVANIAKVHNKQIKLVNDRLEMYLADQVKSEAMRKSKMKQSE
jgi:hypothetical protein